MSPINKKAFLMDIKQGAMANSTPATTFKITKAPAKKPEMFMEKGKLVPKTKTNSQQTQYDLKSL